MIGNTSNITLLQIFACLLLFLVAEYIPRASADGHCIWYGVCNKPQDWIRRNTNCFYDGPALPLQNSTRNILQKYCPDLAATGVSCCDDEQLRNLERNSMIVENILSAGPTCFQNYMRHVCVLACSPVQSNFIKPVRMAPLNATHQCVVEVDYHLSTAYMNETYESCSQVAVTTYPGESQQALDLICGEFGSANCSPQRLFEFMNDQTINPYVPFQANIISGDAPVDGFTPYNPRTYGGLINDPNHMKSSYSISNGVAAPETAIFHFFFFIVSLICLN